MAIIVGYHTLEDRENPEEILKSGPKKCFNKTAWLGYGYYFWDTEIKWAHSWLKDRDYMIFKADIEINENTFDLLGNVQHTIDFEKYYKDLNEILKRLKKPNATVPQVIDYMKRSTDFSKNYNSIRTKLYDFFNNNFVKNDWTEHCLLNKLPIVSIEYSDFFNESFIVTSYPILSKIAFHKVFHPHTLYQELGMFMGNIAAPDLCPVNLSEKDRITQHGFDKWSFRKMGINS